MGMVWVWGQKTMPQSGCWFTAGSGSPVTGLQLWRTVQRAGIKKGAVYTQPLNLS